MKPDTVEFGFSGRACAEGLAGLGTFTPGYVRGLCRGLWGCVGLSILSVDPSAQGEGVLNAVITLEWASPHPGRGREARPRHVTLGRWCLGSQPESARPPVPTHPSVDALRSAVAVLDLSGSGMGLATRRGELLASRCVPSDRTHASIGCAKAWPGELGAL